MKVTFVAIGTENLGVEYLSSALKSAGHEVELVFDPGLFDDKYYFHIPSIGKIFNQREKIIKRIINSKPDLVCFSVMTDTYKWGVDVAKSIKDKIKSPIVFGGIHPTLVPEDVIKNDCIDIIGLGECEEAIVELCEKLSKNEGIKDVKNFWVKENGVVFKNELRQINTNLDSTLFPDKELFADDVRIKDCYMIQTSRGCPFRCSYCSNAFLLDLYKKKGGYLRRRSVDNVIEELRIAKEKFNFKTVSFMDDIFTSNKKWLDDFSKKYMKYINVPFRAISHPLYLDDETAIMLKKAGCYRIELGLQSTNENYRRKILKRREKNEHVIKAFKACENANLSLMVDHIFGLPGETEQQLKDDAIFYNNFKIDRIGCFWLEYFPKTEIVNISKNMGVIDDKRIRNIDMANEKMYHDGGSVVDKNHERTIKNYDFLFKLIPLYSKKRIKKILVKGYYQKYYLIPFFVSILLEVVAALKSKDYDTINYIKHYSYHIKKGLL